MLKQQRNVIVFSVLCALAIIIFLLSYLNLWTGDDYFYGFSYAVRGERINTIGDIIESMNAHYFTHNGRYVAHVFVQLFCGILGQFMFSLCNALVYVGYVWLIMRLVGLKFSQTKALVLTVFLVMLLSNTAYGPPCQVGYIWMPALTLLWMVLFLKFNTVRLNFFAVAGLFLLSIVTGNAHESLCVGIGAALLVYVGMKFRTLSLAGWLMFVGYGIGALALCLSPSSLNFALEKEAQTLPESLVFLAIHSRVFYIFIITLVIYRWKGYITLGKFYRENSFFCNIVVFCLLMNFYIGVGTNRQLAGVELFSGLLTLKLFTIRPFKKFFIGLIGAIVAVLYVLKFYCMFHQRAVYAEIEEKFETSADGTIYIDIPYLHLLNYVYCCNNLEYGDVNVIGSLQDKFGRRCPEKKLKYYPTMLEEVFAGEVKNQAVEFEPGFFFLLMDKRNPATFIIQREYNLLDILRFPAPDLEVGKGASMFDTDEYSIGVVTNDIYLRDNLSAKVVQPE